MFSSKAIYMKIRLLLLIYVLLSLEGLAQPSATIRIDSLQRRGFLLDKGWKWQAGDNPEWANPDFDDSRWSSINPNQSMKMIPGLMEQKIGWFRAVIELSPEVAQRLFSLQITQSVASEIYINGLLARTLGHVSMSEDSIQAVNPFSTHIIGLPYSVSYPFVHIAVRVAYKDHFMYEQVGYNQNKCLRVVLYETEHASRPNRYRQYQIYNGWFLVGIFSILTFLHFAFYFFFRAQRANWYFLGTTFFLGLAFLCVPLVFDYFETLQMYFMTQFIETISFPLAYLFLVRAVYDIYEYPKRAIYKLLVGLIGISFLLLFTPFSIGSFAIELSAEILMTIEVIRVTYLAWQQQKPGAKLILLSMLVSLAMYLFFYGNIILEEQGLITRANFLGIVAYQIAVLCVPLAISIHLAMSFSRVNKDLIEQLRQNNALIEKNLAAEQEKQHLLAQQNEVLEHQVNERTAELKKSLEDLQFAQNQLIQKEKLASLGELTAGIAHEIQNPLNFVNNFSELSVELIEEAPKPPMGAKEDWLPQEAPFGGWGAFFDDLRQNLQKIHHHGKRASNIVKSMLQHSRASTGERTLTDINLLADECMRLSYHGMRAKEKSENGVRFNANFETHLLEELPKINIVAEDINRVLLNLLNNAFYAVKHRATQLRDTSPNSPYMPKVVIATSQIAGQNGKPAMICIKVSDNGTGIAKANIEKIFQPFFTTKPTGEGTGLGLSLSYEIITKGHNGSLEVESTPATKDHDGGTTFWVKLPLSPPSNQR